MHATVFMLLMHACIYGYMHACMHIYMHAYTHTHTHAHTHTHTHHQVFTTVCFTWLLYAFYSLLTDYFINSNSSAYRYILRHKVLLHTHTHTHSLSLSLSLSRAHALSFSHPRGLYFLVLSTAI